ncbi:hypothetical protein ACFQHN_29360 [Natrialbaceae archaeon GCM10025896]
MPLYNLTYQFESDGGNIEYKTAQQVQKEAETHGMEIKPVTTGLDIDGDTVGGTVVVDIADDVVPADVFESADAISSIPVDRESEGDNGENSIEAPPADPEPAMDVHRFESNSEVAAVLADVSETPGRGALFHADLTHCQPFKRDLWLVTIRSETVERSELTKADLLAFYFEHLDLFEDTPSLKIGVYHGTAEAPIQLSLVASLTDPADAQKLAQQIKSQSPTNFYRFELTKKSLVVGEATHGPGQIEAIFQNAAGDELSSREIAYRRWHEELAASYHPLGIIVEGELYRPVPGDNSTDADVGEPLVLASYRDGNGKPWQFGLTRYDNQLLMTQARASPAKFDPVLKRFPIETQELGDEPLVFSHTVSRRVWSEDPQNLHIQSQRSEGLITQFVYKNSAGWHLIQPKANRDPDEPADAAFEQTRLDGVSVRSSKLSANTDGETKATVEHEYQIANDVFDACECLYALSYYEANEESFDRLQWGRSLMPRRTKS